MDDKYKSKKQLIKELEKLRQHLAEYEDQKSEKRLLSELDELEKEHNWPEKALHELEMRYQALIETNLYGIQEIDIYGIITFMNSVQYKILGYTMGELKGKQIWDLLASDEDREELTAYLTQIAEGEYAPFPWVGKYIRKDGSIIELQVDWKYRQDDKGRISGFVSVISGILSQKTSDVPLPDGVVEEVKDDLSVQADEVAEQPVETSEERTDETDETDDEIVPLVSEIAETPEAISEPESADPSHGLRLKAPDDKSMTSKLDEIQQQLDYLQQVMLKSEQNREKTESDEKEKGKEEGRRVSITPKDASVSMILQVVTKLLQRIDILHQEFESKLKYDTHKNKIIDNLHTDLQDYKNDFLKKYLKSIIMDVIQIIDNIRKLASHYTSRRLSEDDATKLANLLESIPSDLEDLFYRHGVKPFTCEGETFDPTRQRVLKTIETQEPDQDKTIAERLRPGYEWDGKVIRPEMITAYLYKEADTTEEDD